jgi:hypothetical protein
MGVNRHKVGLFDGASRRADPVGDFSILAGGLAVAANAVEQDAVAFQNDALTDWTMRQLPFTCVSVSFLHRCANASFCSC